VWQNKEKCYCLTLSRHCASVSEEQILLLSGW